ncbi:glycosyltransferase family 2 protein [Planktothrix agardhii]|uniref:Glycosyl transferase family 2 n=1 Tax=Planktothrix agardhii No758 TaxID=1964479 RepID=A0A1U9WXN8_PLAAG|nr:glycosyltransferase family 2 protein [Planktothrix agardhii]AQY61027.1 glycosyl transferase family 2 [Planktothrix agardhii No758]CAD5973004.1 Putative glycosyltransferase EpsE [Planktothrix agardhii]
MTKVTVCIPTFNRYHILPFAIENVQKQTYSDWELIVCDDGSTDETPELMAKYQDPRIRYIRHRQNIGKSNNMRSGFEAATGDYFIKFDDDDRLTPEFLEKTIAILDQYPEVDFVGTDHWIIDINNQRDESATKQNSQRWGRTKLTEGIVNNLLEVVFIQQSFQVGATLFCRQDLLDVNFMRPNLQNCEDNDLFVRLALAGKRGYYLPQRLMEYRVHAEQQGINRAIPYLRDKLNYLDSFKFEPETCESIRQSRLAETQLLLGLRLIETGETQTGRQLVWQGKSYSTLKAGTGLILSVLPMKLRQSAFDQLRKLQNR